LEGQIRKKFPDEDDLMFTMATGPLGCLEVIMKTADGKEQTLHTKLGGEGYIDTDAKVQKILDGIAKVM